MEINKVGTGAAQFESAKTAGFVEIGKLKDGVNVHRIIAGPALVETIWYPTLAEKDGEIVQSMRTIARPREGCIVDKLAKLDQSRMRQKMADEGADAEDIKKCKSQLQANRGYRFLVFDREADGGGAPTVRPYDYPFTVMDQLEDLQATESQKHPGQLEYGMAFMFDVYIERSKDDTKKNVKYATSYSVKPVIDTLPTVKGKVVPKEWIKWTPDQGECPYKMEDYFTEEELAAIDAYSSDLEKLTTPDTEEQIIAKLTKNPIFVDAIVTFGENKNNPMFPALKDPETRQEVFEEFKTFLIEGGVAAAQLEEHKTDSKPKEIPKADASTMAGKAKLGLKLDLAKKVDAQATVVDEKPSQPATAAPAVNAKPAIKKIWGAPKK